MAAHHRLLQSCLELYISRTTLKLLFHSIMKAVIRLVAALITVVLLYVTRHYRNARPAYDRTEAGRMFYNWTSGAIQANFAQLVEAVSDQQREHLNRLRMCDLLVGIPFFVRWPFPLGHGVANPRN